MMENKMNQKKRLLEEATCTAGTESSQKGAEDFCDVMAEKTDLKEVKELVETFVSAVGKNQQKASQFVDMKIMMDVVKDLKIVLVTESVQYACVGVVYSKKTSSCKKLTDLSFAERDSNESSPKPHSSKCNCDCGQCSRVQSLNNEVIVPPKPKKRKWMSIFGLKK